MESRSCKWLKEVARGEIQDKTENYIIKDVILLFAHAKLSAIFFA